jgi:FdhD protein
VIRPDWRELLAEEPLLIRFGDQPLVTLMRTPGSEVELALGFLRTEGIIRSAGEVGTITFRQDGAGGGNVVEVTPADVAAGGAARAPGRGIPSHRRVFSSCGVCGFEQIREVARDLAPFSLPAGRLTCGQVVALAGQMRERQAGFRSTGASHAAALAVRPLDAASLERAIVREDVGRHNALDKVVGAAMESAVDLGQGVLCLSSRLSFEMVAKAARAGIVDVVAVSAPTTLAVDLAQRLGMFLAGFARGDAFTGYSGVEALAAVPE